MTGGQGDGAVSVVVTSCGRHDLLLRTLETFLASNSYPLAELIVVEDGPKPATGLDALPHEVTAICTGARVGQIAAIDYAYSHVRTPWIFHMEDDWEFYRPGFIERSFDVLRAHPDCLQVWIRALDDTNGHPLDPETQRDGAAEWRRVPADYLGLWHGFSFNPGLRRLSDYVEIGGYGIHTLGAPEWTDQRGTREAIIGKVYRDMGRYAAVLSDTGGAGYVRHLGEARSVKDAAPDVIWNGP